MASVYGIVRSIARAGAAGPMLRNMVGLKPTHREPDPAPNTLGFVTLVESEIIPRLVVAHSHDDYAGTIATHGGAAISTAEALAFAPRALECDACHLLDDVEAFLERGVCVDRIFVDLLAPAARHLGVMWEEDDADFVAVTMALWRLQEVVRELSARVPVRSGGPMRRALFSVMPGEDHSFGTVLVEDVFRRAGWMTDLVTRCDTSELLARVAGTEYDLVGLTVTGDDHCKTVPSIINGIRSVSRNPKVGIMVGGRIFNDNPALAERLGADATAGDALAALEVARDLVDGRADLYEFSD